MGRARVVPGGSGGDIPDRLRLGGLGLLALLLGARSSHAAKFLAASGNHLSEIIGKDTITSENAIM
jgi:hypothetical protein